jgi:hypothetical protein
MPRINKLTAILIFVFTSTVAASVLALSQANQDAANSGGRGISQDGERERLKNQFPVVDYDAPEDPDPDKRKERKAKGRKYDDFLFVRKEPSTYITESVFHTEWYQHAEALPAKQSQKIVIGVVTSSQAHLSNDKTGVYTESVIEVEEVLKGDGGNIATGAKISVDRPGGLVRYPGGHTRLYRFANMNAPALGKEYLFFLTNPEPLQNYGVITAYELSPRGVAPLDSMPIFQAFAGMGKDEFLGKVRDAIRTPN